MRVWLTLLMLCVGTVFTPAYGDAGDKKIRLSGNLQEQVPNRLSVKEIEQRAPLTQATLYNPWEKRTETYKGVLLTDFIHAFGRPGIRSLVLKAIDDYEATFTQADWENFRIILVTQVNGHYISVREKGPMRVVFPDYDTREKAYELNLPKWLWMINRIELN